MMRLACTGFGVATLMIAGCGQRAAPVVDGAILDAAYNIEQGLPVDAPPAADKSPLAPDHRWADQASPTDKDKIIRACVVAAACAFMGGPYPLFSPSACVDAFDRVGWYTWQKFHTPDPVLVAQLLKCTASADCKAFRSCFGGGWVSLSRCREGGLCNGSKLKPSFAADVPSFDCAAIGATCVDLFSGAQRACCNDKVCSGSNTVSCQGAKGEYCHFWGAYMAFDCALTGRVCTTDPAYLCTGTGGTCDPLQPVTCQGSKASYCAGGKMAQVDCSQYHFRSACAAGSKGMPCKPAGAQCGPESYSGSCQGNQLTLCVNGFEHVVDCPALGFTTCHLPAGVGYATCVDIPPP